ncbi:MAG: glycosyltransferase [Gemmatimonadota bacterium]
MTTVGLVLLGLPAFFFLYAYLLYPASLLLLTARRRDAPGRGRARSEWPQVSFSLPAHNEEARIRGALEALLAIDYPSDRRQIVVVSDASTDRTDEIVREFADRGVELLRLEERGGKTAAENAAAPYLRGSIVINTDASIRILPESVKPLVAAFDDPSVGVASGRDRSVGDASTESNQGETGYVGYEMWVRSLETRFGSIVGASGCFYAIRSDLHRALLPEALSRDFASALIARERGYRAVSVDPAVCLVPRTGSLKAELRRKARTMARGLDTLWFKRRLLNPVRAGSFAWQLFSHKLCRWLVPLTLPLGLLGLVLLSPRSLFFGVLLVAALAFLALGLVGLVWPEDRPLPRIVRTCAFVTASVWAGLVAWLKAFRRERSAVWEPTRRVEVSGDQA